MTKFLLPLLFAIFIATSTHAVAPKPEDLARTAAEEWLALVDGNKFVESWQKLDPGFAKKVSKKKWAASLTEIRGPLGKLDSRKLKSAEYTKELPGAPEGEYVVLQFDVSFDRRKAATEKIIMILGKDLLWRAAGYSVR
jgi:hypothetical protein